MPQNGKTIAAIQALLQETKSKAGLRAAYVTMEGHWVISFHPNPTALIIMDESTSIPHEVFKEIEKKILKRNL